MDLRVQKTLRNIRTVFIELVNEKPIDNITVKELCERALINKATFYLHYENMGELIATFEDEFVNEISGEIDYAALFFTDPEAFLMKLWQSYQTKSYGAVLLQGKRGWELLSLLIEALRRSIYQTCPEIKEIKGADMALTFCIYGFSGVGPLHRNESLEDRAKQSGRAITVILKEFGLWQGKNSAQL